MDWNERKALSNKPLPFTWLKIFAIERNTEGLVFANRAKRRSLARTAKLARRQAMRNMPTIVKSAQEKTRRKQASASKRKNRN